uniref:hypothetical protein n=1 Tax=Paractinoplanes polyasparticus TaxID=2856853 RepID=UPI001C84647E|nr:hypothetical protein [Actinoplanes polyasparticus]
MVSLGDNCPARIELSDSQIHWLRRRPYAMRQVRRIYECQIEFGHDGAHGDLGQQSDMIEWWIRWTLSASEIEQVVACSTAPGESEQDVVCLLFEGHLGRHSFQLMQR